MTNPLVVTSVSGTAVPILGNDVDTDRIVPARFLKEVTFDNMGEYLFYDVRYSNGQKNLDHPLNQIQFSNASIMLVENNFGCGSSREHAPQAIKRAGFNLIIGESFAEIFSGNCKALGIVTVALVRSDLDALFSHVQSHPDAALDFDLITSQLSISGIQQPFLASMKDAHRTSFLDGTWDELALLKLNNKKIDELAIQLPYFNW
jgi:3-isopropylmalate/(R)-2-methylmalate dehydratase small subunit